MFHISSYFTFSVFHPLYPYNSLSHSNSVVYIALKCSLFISQFLEHCKTTHALGRVGEAEEVAKSIAFLASSDSSFITGVQLPIDGGRHAMCPR